MTQLFLMRVLTLAVPLTFAPAALCAQAVGTLPEGSPYLDLRGGQRAGIDIGYLSTGSDPAGVGPKSAAYVGLNYELHASGPVYLTSHLFGASTDRRMLDYTKKASVRDVGNRSSVLIGADAGLALALTGDRTWHGVQPLVHVGAGVVLGATDKRDVSQYAFGTHLLLSYGLGARWVTGPNSELRADVTWFSWQLKYPELYRSTEGDPVAIRATGSLTPWVRNRAMTLSYALGIFR